MTVALVHEPPGALTAEQLDGMVRRALALAPPPAFGPRDWIVIKPNIVCRYPDPMAIPGMVTDLRVVRSLIAWLVEHGRGGRITIAEGAGAWRSGGWTTDWSGAYGGLSYAALALECAARYPGVAFDLLDLNYGGAVEWRCSGRRFQLARAVAECDALVTLSPLKTNIGAGVSLALKNSFGTAPGSVYGFPKFGLHALGPLEELIVDVFSFRPADYALLGGPWGIEGNPDASVPHNLLVAGQNCVAVDTVAAMAMGFDPAALPYLRVAAERGLGCGEITIAGCGLEEARRSYRKSKVKCQKSKVKSGIGA